MPRLTSQQASAEALSLVESANNLPGFSTVLYAEGAPTYLTVAWRYGYIEEVPLYGVLPSLSSKLCAAAAADTNAGDTASAEKTILTVITMGKRVQRASPPNPVGMQVLMLGYNPVLRSGYTALAKLYQSTNRPDDARRATEAAAAAAQDDKTIFDAWQASYMFGCVDEE